MTPSEKHSSTAPSVGQPEMLYEARSVSVKYGGIKALHDVSFAAKKNEILALIGPNGAGKTSLFNCMTSVSVPDQGQFVFDGCDVTKLKAHEIAQVGIRRTFQNLALYPRLTVLENVLVGAHKLVSCSWLDTVLRLKGFLKSERFLRKTAIEVLDFMNLNHLADKNVTELSYGMAKQVELARVLVSQPKLLLLDEPASGLNPKLVEELSHLLTKITIEFGATIILVEHNMKLVSAVANHVVVLNLGEKIAEGSPLDIKRNPNVVRAYLGDPS